jgi:cytochrome c oxidase subunit 4
LVVLTVLTVVTSRLDLGSFNVPLAMIIAITKAMLVVTVFMAVKWDNKVNALVIGLSVVFVSIFLIFTLFDTAFRGDLSNVNPKTIMDMEQAESGATAPMPAAH